MSMLEGEWGHLPPPMSSLGVYYWTAVNRMTYKCKAISRNFHESAVHSGRLARPLIYKYGSNMELQIQFNPIRGETHRLNLWWKPLVTTNGFTFSEIYWDYFDSSTNDGAIRVSAPLPSTHNIHLWVHRECTMGTHNGHALRMHSKAWWGRPECWLNVSSCVPTTHLWMPRGGNTLFPYDAAPYLFHPVGSNHVQVTPWASNKPEDWTDVITVNIFHSNSRYTFM